MFGNDLDILFSVDTASKHYYITADILLFHNTSLEIVDRGITYSCYYAITTKQWLCYEMLVISASMWSVMTTHSGVGGGGCVGGRGGRDWWLLIDDDGDDDIITAIAPVPINKYDYYYYYY